MRRALALTAVLGALAVGVPEGSAASAVPAPTYSIQSTLAGQKVNTFFKGQWTVNRVGKSATFYESGTNPPGVVTTIDALWTSADVTVYKNIAAVAYNLANDHTGVGGGSGFTAGIRVRTPGRAWGRWYDLQSTYQLGADHQEGGQKFASPVTLKGKRQFQFRLHSVIQDASTESESWTVYANN
jgi:hypothetical protein